MAKCEHRPTQNTRILEYMARYGSITSNEALMHLSVARLASRICDLRMLGYPIISERVKVTNKFGEITYIKRYKLVGKEIPTEPQKIDSEGK